MNIFVLDKNPKIAAQMLCDKHVPKMLLESVQLLSTVARTQKGIGPSDTYIADGVAVYKTTHRNHPCTKWLLSNLKHISWLITYTEALADEYTVRFGRIHKSSTVLSVLVQELECTKTFDFNSLEYVKVVPEQFRCVDIVEAYRQYYHTKTFASWTRGRPTPTWFLPVKVGSVNA